MNSPAKTTGRRSPERLRFLTCGSVDDGKSTLIGRLLYDSGQVLDDQLETLERDSRRHGTAAGALDFSLLVDGLEAEREQNITIDVAYRYFATATRSFMVADTPGHEQYTRNMATGASTADLAVMLVDARKGVLSQTRRHARICALMGIKHVVLAVNKIDLIGFDRRVFEVMASDFERFAVDLGFGSIQSIPVSALRGDNIFRRSVHAPWYNGPTLIEHLERVEVLSDLAAKPLRMAVQLVRRPSSDSRILAGRIASGTLVVGQDIAVAVSGATAKVKSILGPDGDLELAEAGLAVSLTLTSEVDAARGDLLVAPQARPTVADQFEAHLVWMNTEPMRPGRRHLMRIGARWVFASVSQLKHRLNINTGHCESADQLALNEIGVVAVATDLPVAFDAYGDDRSTGAFILVDRDTNAIVAAGMIDAPRTETINVRYTPELVEKAARLRLKGHRPLCVWITGSPGAVKADLASTLEQRLLQLGMHTSVLEGEKLRIGLGWPARSSDPGHAESVRHIGAVARLMTDAGLVVLACVNAVTPGEREAVRASLPAGDFIELFAGTAVNSASKRPPNNPSTHGLRPDLRVVSSLGGHSQAHQPPELSISGIGGTAADRIGADAQISDSITRIVQRIKI